MRTVSSRLCLALLLVLSIVPIAAAQEGTGEPATEPSDGDVPPEEPEPDVPQDLTLLVPDQVEDGTELSVRLSRRANDDTAETPHVVLGSVASFADAMASAVLQSAGPVLLVPATGGLTPELRAEVLRLDPSEALVLGGTAAVGDQVIADVEELGVPTRRLQGASRFETAVAVAQEVPNAVTALLVRAYDGAGGQSPSAWADSVTAGAFSAQAGLPILLTQTGELPRVTRDYLDRSIIRSVIIVGGEAAVSSTVEAELRDAGYLTNRLAGSTRFQTALRAGQFRQLTAAARPILIDGTAADGWQAGFAAAQHAAAAGGIVLPTAGDSLPAEIATYLEGATPVVGTCLVSRIACDRARQLAGLSALPAAVQLPPLPTVDEAPALIEDPEEGSDEPEAVDPSLLPTITYNPPPGSAIARGEVIVLGVDDPHRILTGEVNILSNCEPRAVREYLAEGSVAFSLATSNDRVTGDGNPADGDVPVQAQPGTGDANGPVGEPVPGQTAEPIEPNEGPPADPQQESCAVTVILPVIQDQDEDAAAEDPVVGEPDADAEEETDEEGPAGLAVNDEVAFRVVDLRPEIRVSSFPQRVGDPVVFTDVSDGPIDAWRWDFDDGATSREQHPQHTYAEPSCYDVELEVTSPLRHWLTGRGFVDREVRTVAVDPVPGDPSVVQVQLRDVLDDSPLVGEAIQMVDPDGGLVLATAVTGADGRGVFDDVPTGRFIFRYGADPLDTLLTQAVPPSHTLCPTLRFGPTGDLVLTVTDEAGDPVPEARVLLEFGIDGAIEARTNAGGIFVGTELSATDYLLTVTAPGRGISRSTVAVLEDDVVLEDVVLLPSG